MAKDYGQRPSTLLHIDATEYEWLAHSVDSATWLWGTYIDGKLHERDEVKTGKNKGKSKPRYTLTELLAEPEQRAAIRRRNFRGVRGLVPPKTGGT